MIQTGIYADFVVVDGGEGGTGAAPLEFSDSLGAPSTKACSSSGTLLSARDPDRLKIGASGKMVTASAMARSMALVPTGATPREPSCSRSAASSRSAATPTVARWASRPQDPKLQRALIVPDKAERVHNFHRNTVHALAELIAAMGLDHTND